jgi:Family of unknown function (DUF6221)
MMRDVSEQLAEWLAAQVDADESWIGAENADNGLCATNIGVHLDPERALAEAEFKRAMLAEVASMRHRYVDGDSFYSCPQAVSPWPDDGGEPGSGCSDDDLAGAPCDCGRDQRAARMLGAMAEVFKDRPGYTEVVA